MLYRSASQAKLGRWSRLNFRSDLAKNNPKKLSYDPGSKARNDRQHEGGVSRIVQLVLHLAPGQLHFLHRLAFGPVFNLQ